MNYIIGIFEACPNTHLPYRYKCMFFGRAMYVDCYSGHLESVRGLDGVKKKYKKLQFQLALLELKGCNDV